MAPIKSTYLPCFTQLGTKAETDRRLTLGSSRPKCICPLRYQWWQKSHTCFVLLPFYRPYHFFFIFPPCLSFLL